jgi:FtsP/CotA-like multicopper oxidase with cupredoxin domain
VPPRPLGLEPLFVAPGQRVDLLVGTIEDQAIIALDLGVDSVEVAFLLATGQAGEGVAENFALPPNPVPMPPDAVAVPRAVTLTLEGGAKGGLKSATVGTARLDLRQLLERALAWAINGVAGTGGPVLFSAAKGEALMLTIDNKTAFAQPLCLHGHVWIVVEQGGQPVSQPQWRDTLVVGAMAQAKAYLVADNPGVWAIQSLVAERSDAGLVGGFSVADMP